MSAPVRTLRQALLEHGLDMARVKQRLARLGLDGERAAEEIEEAAWAELTAPEPDGATTTGDAPVRRRRERVRLLLHRFALRSRPHDAMPVAFSGNVSSDDGSRLRLYLGLQPPPRAALDELERIERALSEPVGSTPGERTLADTFGLDAAELDALWLLVVPATWPHVLLLLDAVYEARTNAALPQAFLRHLLDGAATPRTLAPHGPLRRYALLVPSEDGHLRAAPRAIGLLCGAPRPDEVESVSFERQAPELTGIARRLAPPRNSIPLAQHNEAAFGRLHGGGAERLLVTGADGSGARAVAFRLACELNGVNATRPVFEVDLAALAGASDEVGCVLLREALLARAVLLLRHAHALAADSYSAATRTALLESLARERLPLVVDGGALGSLALFERVAAPLGLRHLPLTLPPPEERTRLWQATLENAPAAEMLDVAPHEVSDALGPFPLGVDHMADALVLARSLDGGPTSIPALRRACGLLVTHRLGEFASKVETRAQWDDLVAPDEVREALSDLVQQVRLSRYVLDELGYGKRVSYGHGLTAMFAGPSGTGKTMAATLIAGSLGVELYRVDLSRVVSKYIGETEQRLAALFEEARGTGAALLFDEADSLFAKRTEIKSSNDRYANLEVNFLLQQIEEHTGLSLLTTNYAHNIDRAFLRRIRFHIEFHEPDEEAREQLWRGMIPESAPLDDTIDFEELARRYELSGGAIRNAVLRAAFRAAGDDRPLDQQHLEQAARAELAAMGKLQWEP